MSKRSFALYLEDIKDSIERIKKYTQRLTFDDFNKDQKTIDAVVRNLEIIGEAARNFPKEVKLKHRQIPWKEITGTRDKVIHGYFVVDTGILWKTIQEDIPRLKEQLKQMKEE